MVDGAGRRVYCGAMPRKKRGAVSVLVELRADAAGPGAAARRVTDAVPGVELDASYDPVPMDGGAVIVRCDVAGQAQIDALKRQPGVINVWTDTPIAPMSPKI